MKKVIAVFFCLFLFGCANEKKTDTANKLQETAKTDEKADFITQSQDFGSGNTQTGSINTGTTQSGGQEASTKPAAKPMLIGEGTGNAKNVLIEFYSSINDKQFAKSLDMLDERMKNMKSVTDYFNETRLSRFINGIDGGLSIKNITQTPANLIHDPTKNYTARFNYDLVYGISGTLYVESRNMIVSFDSQKNLFSITSISCLKNCGRYPFFNLDKFGIK